MKLKRKHPKPQGDPHCGDFGGFREGMEIRCKRDPDHEGDHECSTEKAIYLWRNKKKTPA
jgi:hypothetical protein